MTLQGAGPGTGGGRSEGVDGIGVSRFQHPQHCSAKTSSWRPETSLEAKSATVGAWDGATGTIGEFER
jgi:hypothetical protein